MTQDEIIEMARQACPYTSESLRGAFYDGFVKASKLVAAKEREACAKVCEQSDDDGEGPDCWDWRSKDYAAAIRARGEA